MYLRPKRMKTGLAFVGGLSVSIVLLAAGTWWYGTQRNQLEQAAYRQAKADVEMAWMAAHPTEPAYVFARDMMAGSTISESDLMLTDIGVDTLPSDAVLKPEALIGRVVRADVRAKMLCAGSLLYQDEEYPDDARIQEYAAIRLPSRLERNQSVDVRITFPNGLDYVVLAKKTVQDLERGEDGAVDLIWLTLQESELLRMSSAMVDAYLHPGTTLYAVTYVAPDIQKAAVCTYPANAYVQDLIRANPNIVACAVTELERANRKWFDAIPDPQPQQPLAVVPIPDAVQSAGARQAESLRTNAGPMASGAGSAGVEGAPGQSVQPLEKQQEMAPATGNESPATGQVRSGDASGGTVPAGGMPGGPNNREGETGTSGGVDPHGGL